MHLLMLFPATILLTAAIAGPATRAAAPEHGDTPMIENLFTAIRSKDIDAVVHLVDADPSLLAKRNAQGISALSWAAYMKDPAIIEALRARRGTPDLYEACIVGDEAAVAAEIVRDPASINVPAPDGFTALGLAVFFGHPALAARLIDAGADVNARATNRQHVGPIHAALAREDLATLERLLVHGADPNLPQEQGIRPLHEAARQGSFTAAALLLLFGADPALTSEDGQRPADLARSEGHAAWARRIEAARPPVAVSAPAG